MDWNKEFGALQEGSNRNWWKPTPGTHVVVFISDGEEYTLEWEGKTIPKVRFDVEVNKQKFDWGITKGKTVNSLYGQLATIGNKYKTMVGQKVTLIVIGSGEDIKYTVVEAANIIGSQNQEIDMTKPYSTPPFGLNRPG